ncbi:MAG: restriction endonuclease [Myxococcales bacterium]|nr:restriction endonuclease [Myxococcales bacterium]
MTFTEAAAEVLRLAGKPLHFKDITQMAIDKSLLSHVGKTPDVTMGARLSLQIKKEPDGAIVRVKPGVFGLREWESGGKKKGKKKAEEAEVEARTPSLFNDASDEPSADDDGADAFAALASDIDAASDPVPARKVESGPPVDDDDEPLVLDADEKMRGELAASGSELFEEEDDDDQPLFGGPEPVPGAAPGAAGPAGEGGRRRRRRRRRGKRDEGGAPGQTFGGASRPPSFEGSATAGDDEDETIGVTIGDERDEQPTRRAIVLERVPQQQQGRGNQGGGKQQDFRAPGFQRSGNFDLSASPALEGTEPIDELAGRDLSDLVLSVLLTSDRNQGPVPFRAIAEAAQRKGRLTGDLNVATTALAASARADNLRRDAEGLRPRFRFAQGGRVAPTDWSLGSDLLRLEQEAVAALDRYRDAARRTLASKLQKDLSGPALIELLLVALERLGFRDIKPVRRAGLPGGESHFSAVHVTLNDEVRTAIVLRRDGREIGRERVIDLRGSLHHYGGGSGAASTGWLITTGQCLSGAREEAAAPGTPPVALFDSVAFAKLLEQAGVGVTKTRFDLPFPDLELLETLRGV